MDEPELWAASGAMALTGRSEGPPLLTPGRPAGQVAAGLARLGLALPGLLGERAAYAGLTRRAPWSCGGATRVLPSADGHVVLSLARPSDLEMLPALVEGDFAPTAARAWDDLALWAADNRTAEIAARMELLGLPGGAVPVEPPEDRPGVVTQELGRRTPTDRPLVVDLTSLWAGPLCAHLLGLLGARVVKVESATRPDGARSGQAAFFDLLHNGHEQVVLDFSADRDRLQELLAGADLVLEASRPRALRQLGVSAEDVVSGGTSWLSITAAGRASAAVGFGDDVAARAGLCLRHEGDVLLVGDAIADPLTGVAAAAAAAEALSSHEARLIDVSMLHVAAEAAAGDRVAHVTELRDGRWWIETARGRFPVADPAPRPGSAS